MQIRKLTVDNWVTLGNELTDPVHTDGVASRFPDLKIVAGHGCWPYVAEIIAVAFKH